MSLGVLSSVLFKRLSCVASVLTNINMDVDDPPMLGRSGRNKQVGLHMDQLGVHMDQLGLLMDQVGLHMDHVGLHMDQVGLHWIKANKCSQY